jgi:carbon monoxide dehydrogenase subunit G
VIWHIINLKLKTSNALDMVGQVQMEASVEDVWWALNDPDVLRRCIPGCEALSRQSDQRMAATVVLKIGACHGLLN